MQSESYEVSDPAYEKHVIVYVHYWIHGLPKTNWINCLYFYGQALASRPRAL